MLSVIILSYNTADLTLKCLDHVYRSKGIDYEVIVVDNASSDESVNRIKKAFPKVRVIENEINVGFAAGNNQGMKLAKGDKFLLLNSDCFVNTDTLKKAYELDYDVAGCKLLNEDGSIQQSWGYFPTLRRIAQLMLFVDNLPLIRRSIDSIHVRDLARYNKSAKVDWVTGAFVMLKRSAWQEVGGIDEKYFMYGEEMEWMYRIKKAGFEVWFTPNTSAMHLQGASTKSKAKMLLSEMKGFIYWFDKHNSAVESAVLKSLLVFGCAMRIPAWAVWGKWDLVRTYKDVLTQLVTRQQR